MSHKSQLWLPRDQRKSKEDRARTAKQFFFVFGKATITTNNYPALNDLAVVLQEDKSLLLDIEGHTDNVGSDTSNLKLSEQRAAAAKLYLLQKGISAERISAVGFGETQPLATNSTPAGRVQTRRIVLKIKNH